MNVAVHAVLESALEDIYGLKEGQKIRDHALLNYFASLANSNKNEDEFDFNFVQSLIANGANVDCTDKNGQTVFHEVARSWNLDVAMFLLDRGKTAFLVINAFSQCVVARENEKKLSKTQDQKRVKKQVKLAFLYA